MSRVLAATFASVYSHHVAKVERTGRTKDEPAKGRPMERVLRA